MKTRIGFGLVCVVCVQLAVLGYLWHASAAGRASAAMQPVARGVVVQARADAPVLGASDADVRLTEFGDFQCPYCRALNPTLLRFVKAHSDVSLTYRYYPLPVHPAAYAMAEAAECARRYGQFWEAALELYAMPGNWDEQRFLTSGLPRLATRIGIAAPELASCVHDPSVAAAIDGDVSEARRIGVPGTPALLVGDKLYLGNLTYEQLVSIYQGFASTSRFASTSK